MKKYMVEMTEEVYDALVNLLYEEKHSSDQFGDIVYLGGTEMATEHQVLANFNIADNLTICEDKKSGE